MSGHLTEGEAKEYWGSQVTVTMARPQAVALSNVIRYSIRASEQDERADTIILYELQELVLSALVGDAYVSLTTHDRPFDLAIPRSWGELEAIVEPLAPFAWDLFSGYARAAKQTFYENAGTPLFLRACAGVALTLRDEFDPNQPPPPVEADFQRAWARAVGGVLLDPDFTGAERERLYPPKEEPDATQLAS